MNEPTLFDEKLPRWKRVWYLLKEGPKNTGDFLKVYGLGAEYRAAISEARKNLAPFGVRIEATRQREGCWCYRLLEPKDEKTS